MNIRKTIAVISSAVMMLSFAALPASAEESYDNVSRKPFSVPDTNGKKKLYEIDGKVFSIELGKSEPFTGKTKNDKGSRYFINGSLYFGWQKIDGKWYYFDPDNKGYMAKDTAKTSVGSYALDADGSWNGKLSSSAKAPQGFFLSCTEKDDSTGDFFEIYVNSKLEKRYSHVSVASLDPKFEGNADMNISHKDRQIIYDMFMSCELDKVEGKLDYANLGEDSEPVFGYDNDLFELRFCISDDGKEQSITGSNRLFDYYDQSADVQHTAYFVAFLNNYISSRSEMAKIVDDFNKAANGETVSDKPEAEEAVPPKDSAEVSKSFNAYDSRIYKTSAEGLKQKALLTSEEEAWDFTQDILRPVYGKDKKFISYLVNYEQEFFEDHIIYVEIYNSASGARQFRFERVEKISTDEGEDIRIVYTSDLPEAGATDDEVDFVVITVLNRDDAGKFNNIYNYYI